MVTNAVEAVGFGLILWFLYILWPPAAILGGGLLLILWANARTSKGKTAAAIGAGWKAAKLAAAEHETLRRIS